MSVAQELLHEGLPLASIKDMLPFAGAASLMLAGSLSAKKVTAHWHQTIGPKQIGIPLHRGNPILLPEYTQADVDDYERAIAAGEEVTQVSHYVMKQPDWYLVPPFKTLQPVVLSDNGTYINFPFESKEGEQLQIHANFAWNVIEEGDNPIYALTRVKTQFVDKKDKPEVIADKHVDELGKLIGFLGAASLGDALYDKKGEQLKQLSPAAKRRIQEKTIKETNKDAAYYGVNISWLRLLPVVRTGEEVLAQAIRDSKKESDYANVIAITRRLMEKEKDEQEYETEPIATEQTAAAAAA